jgi:uncharacterized protein (TIGR00369 family)
MGEVNLRELGRCVDEEIPFHKYLGIRVEELRTGYARLVLPFRPEFIGDKRRPALHGGLLSTLVDTSGGTAVWTNFPPSARISTVDMRVDYLNPGPPEEIVAEAEVVRLGNRVGVVHVTVYGRSDPSTIVAEGRGVYNIRTAKAPEK